jgi:hypothetical protein
MCFFSFDGVFVKLNNRRRRYRRQRAAGSCFTVAPINDLSRRSRYFLANGNRAGQRLNADEVFFARSETSSPKFLCKP